MFYNIYLIMTHLAYLQDYLPDYEKAEQFIASLVYTFSILFKVCTRTPPVISLLNSYLLEK